MPATEILNASGGEPVILENRHIKLTILPDLGAKIFSIFDKATGREILWQNPEIPPKVPSTSEPFDDVWSGGWDEVFPNDYPCVYNGIELIDHGQLWNVKWDFSNKEEIDGGRIAVFSVFSEVLAVSVEKTIILDAESKAFDIQYVIHNSGSGNLEFTWKLHPAFRVDDVSRLIMPCDRVICDKDFNNPQCIHEQYLWPFMPVQNGLDRDMSDLSGTEGSEVFFQYMHMLEGWFEIRYLDGTGFGIRFDRELFPYITYFASYGGWRNHRVAVIEPSTAYPADFSEAAANGRLTSLKAGETLSFKINAYLV